MAEGRWQKEDGMSRIFIFKIRDKSGQ
jgi:hypothetical protein